MPYTQGFERPCECKVACAPAGDLQVNSVTTLCCFEPRLRGGQREKSSGGYTIHLGQKA